jgi:hypothetical protein
VRVGDPTEELTAASANFVKFDTEIVFGVSPRSETEELANWQ